ncbi:aminopeptidase [Haloferax mediterranei ATCC 33500]|uniref:Aminopeptidase n=1 Tax=Haloferax mediterranei (strain ATCC 33500 / DSM 1411 / JCM 8866 / NBRC 14739 / NCIMB 2177 / R-4) TaxID=523841 RepID=I3R178_HALMT|nr:aminopeptidase [Haloferax mediterranei]AFK17988.2 leucyl aminopeptidase [Haloferax mediterranei ATCC 33500]AHZ22593.1 aminopeptidase [Haloferax mediterranei ATCC 33500]EMA02736.1 leucyl aminopeptidase [Haloferax mediterranei ATCC 33500]MDX5988080.1 aminopeptidase [Haloferax mediterranei ATCC 33500]QCQ74534.1 aminopeptidase [Haloferax mediterranei ATCC 33500]
MDPRIREHAQTIVDHSTRIEEGDNVVVSAPAVAEDLVTAICELVGERGAYVVNTDSNSRFMRAFLRASDGEEFETPSHQLALIEETDVLINVRAEENATEQSDVDPATNAAWKRAYKPIQAEALSKRWCLTQHPATGSAQLAGMSTEAYENFVYDAVTLDWEKQAEHQKQMVEILNDADEVRIVSGDETDVTMSVAGNTTINDKGEHNLPGGEVFTAPVKDSVDGEVYFDLPLYRQGREVSGVRVRFEDGEVVNYSAERNEEVLDGVFDTDEGARYLGELGIGMNRSIDRFTYNMLFDEKMGDTVHLAVGSAYPETVGEENERNESAEHVDMIVDMSEDSVIEVDGEVVQRNGTFVFEDDF